MLREEKRGYVGDEVSARHLVVSCMRYLGNVPLHGGTGLSHHLVHRPVGPVADEHRKHQERCQGLPAP